MILAVCGLAGSGKTTVTDMLVEHGFQRLYLPRSLFTELAARGLQRTEANERMLREAMREEEGMAVFAQRELQNITELAQNGNVVVESMYSWSEYKLLRQTFGEEFKVLAVHAPPHVRAQRLAIRPERPLTQEELQSRDYSQIEHIEQAGPIARADIHVLNESTVEELRARVDGILP